MGEKEVADLRAELGALREMVSQLLSRTGERQRLFELKEAARLLAVDPKTVGRMVKTGELMVVMVRGKRLVPVEEIDRIATPPPTPARSRQPRAERAPKYDAAEASRRLAALRKGR